MRLSVFLKPYIQIISKWRYSWKFFHWLNWVEPKHRPLLEIPVFLKAADVLVLPNSASEKISSYTSTLKLFEYMASGRPIVASELLSIKEILNSENSVLVGSDDPESLVGGISKVIENSSFGEMISQKAKEDVKNYTWQKRAERIVAYLGFSL